MLNVAAVPHLGALGTVRPLSASSLHFLSSMSPILLKVNKFITSDMAANATAGLGGVSKSRIPEMCEQESL